MELWLAARFVFLSCLTYDSISGMSYSRESTPNVDTVVAMRMQELCLHQTVVLI
jgi:hypothetical protein